MSRLDDLNIRRFLALIREYSDRTQFIIITHQRQTMEVADTLYGVALESDGTSRVLSRRFRSSNGAPVTSPAAARQLGLGPEKAVEAEDRGAMAQGA